jgi:PIN domain nuclease of toxin-antitoxin system
LIYLDTHVVVWLYQKSLGLISQVARDLINENEIRVSPVVRLELQYLVDVGRIKVPADLIVANLSDTISMSICEKDFNTIIGHALGLSWTRDPFDRLIVANAAIDNSILISKDKNILENYDQARW